MNLTLLEKQERPFSFVPKSIFFSILFLIVLQICFHFYFVNREVIVSDLPKPPNESFLSLFALSDDIVASKVTMLWLQAFDNQPGISIPFAQLDYDQVTSWLKVIQSLDEKSAYPLLSASRLYSKVVDNNKKKKMLEYVKEEYLKYPDERWRWMAHSVYVAKHEIKDLELALYYAKLIREHTSEGVAPSWVRQMEIFILEDMDEIESAKVLIGGLLESGEIKDQNELYFLTQRLKELESK